MSGVWYSKFRLSKNANSLLSMAPEPVVSVGRIVHFKTRGSADGVYPPTAFAAIVTALEGGEQVSLVTFGPGGMRFETGVLKGDQVGQWNWPPRV